jgi:hypothetical protein
VKAPKEPVGTSFAKALAFSIMYFALLLLTATIALNIYVDLYDPPAGNRNADHSFLVSDFAGWLWFAVIVALPALVLLGMSLAARWVWKVFDKKHSNVLA